ncbi:MAG: hypothetical protein AB8F95_21495 [Bacteroidia bacterium]
MSMILTGLGTLLIIFLFGAIVIRPLIAYCGRHAIDANPWLLRLIAGWVFVWIGGPMILRSFFGFSTTGVIWVLLILTIVWYMLVWYRLKKAPKGDLFEDKIDSIGKDKEEE